MTALNSAAIVQALYFETVAVAAVVVVGDSDQGVVGQQDIRFLSRLGEQEGVTGALGSRGVVEVKAVEHDDSGVRRHKYQLVCCL